MPTRFKPNNPDDEAAGIKDWPYPKNELRYSTQQLVDGKLYVFGGTHGMLGDGCNLFMVLDLGTKQWRRLSGTVEPRPKGDYSCPGHRQNASSWVDKDGDRIFLLFGECDRLASPTSTKRILVCGYSYDDLWTWNIKTEKWFRGKMDGNSPCARTEAACVYVRLLLILGCHFCTDLSPTASRSPKDYRLRRIQRQCSDRYFCGRCCQSAGVLVLC